jgi:hypothetical protein
MGCEMLEPHDAKESLTILVVGREDSSSLFSEP